MTGAPDLLDAKLLRAQRDAYKREADKLYEVGGYMAAALRFYAAGDGRGDPYYRDAARALEAWDRATEEFNAS